MVRAGIEPATHGFSVHDSTPENGGKQAESDQDAAHLQRAESAIADEGDALRSLIATTIKNLGADKLRELLRLIEAKRPT